MSQTIFLDPTATPTLPPIALTIGNFDGVHLGHQAMLKKLDDTAKIKGLASAVMIFEPQPREFFDPDNAPARLTNLDEKLIKINKFSPNFILIVPFNANFANLTADEFCAFLQRLNVKAMILGDDFRFGRGRGGDIEFLRNYFDVFQLDSILINQTRVSSTAVRQALKIGDLALAETLLGETYSITGQVVHGDKIGRQLNFPTANIALKRIRPALFGVFGVAVSSACFGDTAYQDTGVRLGSQTLFGCANIGTRPSVNGRDFRLEVHLPNFDGDLYDKVLTVKFLHFLHDEITYQSLDDLKAGIQKDIDALLKWQNAHLPSYT